MSFLLVATGQWQTERLRQSIRHELDTSVQLAPSLNDALERLHSHGNTIELVIIEAKGASEFLNLATPLFAYLKKHAGHIGTLLLWAQIPKALLASSAARGIRADASLQKPFQNNLLFEMIIRAHENHRRQMRDLVLISTLAPPKCDSNLNIIHQNPHPIRRDSAVPTPLNPAIKAVLIDTAPYPLNTPITSEATYTCTRAP